MIVGLTGGIGSGKSTALAIFESLSVPVYQADIEAKKLMNTSEDVKAGVIALLGADAYQNNQLNRAYIAELVFNDKTLLTKLNAIVHPAVHQHFKDFVTKQKKVPYLVYENAILFENNSEKQCDKIIVVAAPIEDRIKRVMKRDCVTKEAVLARIENQWRQEDKIKKADFVIYNNSQEALKKEILQLHEQLIKE